MNEMVDTKDKLTHALDKRGIDESTWRAISNSIFPTGTTQSKLLAIDYCRARNLDIMKKPCHIVPMNVKDPQTGQYSWRDIIMPGISEQRMTAARTNEYAGQDEPIFGPMVEIEFNAITIKAPEFCSVTVYRLLQGEPRAYTHTEWFEEACATTKDGTPNSMWTKRKRGQLAKCAEAGALRKAFPEELGGMNTAEEMEGRVIEGESVDSVNAEHSVGANAVMQKLGKEPQESSLNDFVSDYETAEADIET